jgi:uncharacterized protein (TIGR02117 family)
VLLVPWQFVIAAATEPPPSWRCAPAETRCYSIFVVHNSWHGAIVLRTADLPAPALPEAADFPDSRFIEFSWGDKDYFTDPDAGVFTAIKATLWSGGSVLHLVGLNEHLEAFYRDAEIAELRLSTPAYARLVEYLSRSFARTQAMGRAPASPGLFAYSRFYPSTEQFSLMKTCNTWVAFALLFAGLPMSPGLVLTAAQLSAQIETLKRRPQSKDRSTRPHQPERPPS